MLTSAELQLCYFCATDVRHAFVKRRSIEALFSSGERVCKWERAKVKMPNKSKHKIASSGASNKATPLRSSKHLIPAGKRKRSEYDDGKGFVVSDSSKDTGLMWGEDESYKGESSCEDRDSTQLKRIDTNKRSRLDKQNEKYLRPHRNGLAVEAEELLDDEAQAKERERRRRVKASGATEYLEVAETGQTIIPLELLSEEDSSKKRRGKQNLVFHIENSDTEDDALDWGWSHPSDRERAKKRMDAVATARSRHGSAYLQNRPTGINKRPKAVLEPIDNMFDYAAPKSSGPSVGLYRSSGISSHAPPAMVSSQSQAIFNKTFFDPERIKFSTRSPEQFGQANLTAWSESRQRAPHPRISKPIIVNAAPFATKSPSVPQAYFENQTEIKRDAAKERLFLPPTYEPLTPAATPERTLVRATNQENSTKISRKISRKHATKDADISEDEGYYTALEDMTTVARPFIAPQATTLLGTVTAHAKAVLDAFKGMITTYPISKQDW